MFNNERNLGEMSPAEARRNLEWKFREETWDEIMSMGGLSAKGYHTLKALITIARGDETRILSKVIMELRQQDGLDPENY